MKIRDRIKELRRVKASELLPNPKNWRTHPQSQQNALRSILAEIGYADAVIAYETKNGLMLIDGHLRADTTPDSEVPVLILDVNELEADKLLAIIDPLSSLAEQDTQKLSELFTVLQKNNDLLIGQIWPEYIIDPLSGIDWKPDAEGELPSRPDQIFSIRLDDKEQLARWKSHYKAQHDNGSQLTEGEYLMLLCDANEAA